LATLFKFVLLQKEIIKQLLKMSSKDVQELIDMAKKLEKDLTKEEALKSLVAAGILDEAGNYTKPYKQLEKADA